ncbi:hypothetical protein, partial [Mycobacterium sp.]|uniref:hypothetical protein n=1 Tax=Mycobacterium sp. TaxID=1785 RepID=UPI003F9D349A
MVTLLVAKGDSPTVPDWITAWGTLAAAAIALVAMGFSINAAVKSRRDAGQATDAFKKIAKSHAEISNTGQMQFQLATQQADDALKDEARNVMTTHIGPSAVGNPTAGDQKAVHQADTPGGDGARMGRRVGDLSLTHPIGTSAIKMGYTPSRWHLTSATFSLKTYYSASATSGGGVPSSSREKESQHEDESIDGH